MVVLTASEWMRSDSSEGRLRESAKMAPAVSASTPMTTSSTTATRIFSQSHLRFLRLPPVVRALRRRPVDSGERVYLE